MELLEQRDLLSASSIMELAFQFTDTPQLSDLGQGNRVTLPNEELWYSPGQPLVPVHLSTVVLPVGMEISSVTVDYADSGKLLASGVTLAAVADDNADDATSDESIYVLGDFPNQGPVEFSNWTVAGYSLGQVRVFPIHYAAATGNLTYYEHLQVTLHLAPRLPGSLLEVRDSPADRARVAAMIDNPEALVGYDSVATLAMAGGDAEPGSAQPAGVPGYEYVIITNNALAGSFQPLLNQKLSKGLTATIVTTEWIYATYAGTEIHDNADKIRHYIADAYANQGTRWVLLGGDVEIIPVRGVYASNTSLTNTALPSDLYYACLDGPWNSDGDSLWGESTDGSGGSEIDLLADVYVGRVPASNATEVANFVAKTILYETSPAPHATTAIFLGEVVDAGTYGSASGVAIRDQVLPASWLPALIEHYDTPTFTWNKADLIDDLNASPHVITSLGHSSPTVDARLTLSDIDSLTNAFPYLFYSQGCDGGAFDLVNVSIAEKHIVSANGAFATVMNTREGWYRQGTPGLSHFYALEFWDALLNEGKRHLGEAQQDAKDDNLWRVGPAGTYRWIHFTSTLFGDPETSFQWGANAGGPYAIDEGAALTLAGSASGTGPLTFSWDVNGDGVFGDAAGASPTLTWAQLVGLGIYGGPLSRNVALRVYDSSGTLINSAAALLTVNNVPPTANAGGPYTINEGQDLLLVGSGSDPVDLLTYSWDLNGDNVFGDATGAAPTVTWAQLVALGINDGPGLFNVRVRVNDGDGGVTDSEPVTLTLNNVAPKAAISGPLDLLPGQLGTFTLIATDPSPVDQAANFTFHIDWNGDGIVDQFVIGPSGSTVDRSFDTPGPVRFKVSATDRDAATGSAAAFEVAVRGAMLLPSATTSGLFDLVWGGTSGADHLEIEQLDATTVQLHSLLANGVSDNTVLDFAGVTGRVIARGAGGNDTINASQLATKATLDGGAGNNTLHGGQGGDLLIGGSNGGEGQQGNNVIIAGNGNNTIYGNDAIGAEGSTGGNNLIVGGAGNDTIYGAYGGVKKKDGTPSNGAEGGQNLIVGGGGSDTIYASQQADGAEGGNGSILVGGTTTLDQAALLGVLSEWTSTRTYAQRIANIQGTGTGTRNNGNHFLQATTVHNDGSADQLFSDTNGELNWLLYSFGQDFAQRVKFGESQTDL